MDLNVEAAVRSIMVHGPSRVLVFTDGAYEGIPSRRAREVFGVVPDVIFIRRDGWSLGATKANAAEAYRMWRDEWAAFMRRPGLVEPIDQWREE